MKKPDISELVKYFESGCKEEKLLGLELEHFVIDKKTGHSIPYSNSPGRAGGIEQLLTQLQPLYGEPILSDSGRIIGITGEESAITLEPAAQLEISIAPKSDIAEISAVYEKFIGIISPVLTELGWELKCTGYHPLSKIDEMPLIPKSRYEHMYSHFAKVGTRGKYMMKGSAATQINIDYTSELDFIKKFRVANILGPIFAFVCDNSSTFEGKPYDKHMVRTYIWDDVDRMRSGIPPGALDCEYGFLDYAKYIHDMPEIYTPDDEDSLTDEDMIEHVLSMVFPDVRLKTRLELRMADSMPIGSALDFVKLVSDIFYNEDRLDVLYDKTLGIGNQDVEEAKTALIENGENAVIYGGPVHNWLSEISCELYVKGIEL